MGLRRVLFRNLTILSLNFPVTTVPAFQTFLLVASQNQINCVLLRTYPRMIKSFPYRPSFSARRNSSFLGSRDCSFFCDDAFEIHFLRGLEQFLAPVFDVFGDCELFASFTNCSSSFFLSIKGLSIMNPSFKYSKSKATYTTGFISADFYFQGSVIMALFWSA